MFRLLCITAHPDDEAGNFGGTLLTYRTRGVETGVICLTPGQAASHRGDAKSDQDLANIRKREFAASCEILQVSRPLILDYPDGQLYAGGAHNDDNWDAHGDLEKNHNYHAGRTDKPIAGLLKDLKQRGMLEETLVVWGGEFGRQPTAEYAKGTGRDHNAAGFTMWMAGGGIKGGVVHGATDEIGFHAVEHRQYVTDIHATVLHQLGLDTRKLTVPGRKRLEIDYGRPIREILT